ncbi:MAG: SDR family oxidoreductase, partial [Candidatus Limnocylindrales bacterium]
PELAMRRNGDAVGRLAEAAVHAGVDLIVISTNEVFDGRRTDGRGYRADDPPSPINAYGASKLAGELAARAAFRSARTPALAIVRTAWLYGPPGNDFPEKVARAAERAITAGEALRVVDDETGSPTYTNDVAEGIVEMIGSGEPLAGIHHLVNAGTATRASWARAVLAGLAITPPLVEVPGATWSRVSTPPAWAVLEPTLSPSGEPLRHWTAALADYLPRLRRQLAGPGVVGSRRS